MRSQKERRSFFHQKVSAAAAAALAGRHGEDDAVAGAVADSTAPPLQLEPLPDSVVDFLARLSLLYGVPFEYLVADSRILPAESMRFFYIDRNWIQRSIDGAMSAGISGTRENLFNEQFYQQVYQAVDKAIPRLRMELLHNTGAVGTLATTWSGVIFRSAVVSGYPGLEIKPFTGVDMSTNPPTGTGLLEILRMDRLADDIMLCIFNGVPGYVEFKQPSEGIHFGISRTSPTATTFEVSLRWLGRTSNPDDQAGKQISTGPGQYLTANGQMRTGGQPGVVDVATTVTKIKATMGKARLGNDETFTSAGFAVEMVQSTGVQPYYADAGQPTCEPPSD